jgi:hypothetical protein
MVGAALAAVGVHAPPGRPPVSITGFKRAGARMVSFELDPVVEAA